MAKRFTKQTINWAALEKRVPANQKAQFMAFKAKSDNYFRRVTANPPEPPAIDWADYGKKVPVAGLVDKFKKEYECFDVPYPCDTLSEQIDAQWTKLQGEIKAFCAERQKDIDEATKKLDKIKSLPKFEDITMEMAYDLFPDRTIDPVNRPTFWPHDPEEQPGYKPPQQPGDKKH